MDLTTQLQFVFGLAGISTASLAFVVGLYAFFDSHSRLQENSYSIVATIFLFCLSVTLLVVAIILTSDNRLQIALWVTWIGLGVFALGWVVLFRTFLSLYGRISHMRDKRFLKYVFPISLINNLRSKKYALTVRARNHFLFNPFNFSQDEKNYIMQGYSFLFKGDRNVPLQQIAIDFLVDGLKNEETANYVCCDRPPYQVLSWFKKEEAVPVRLYSHLIIVDAFSPYLSFNDEIMKEANEEVEREGVKVVLAKGMAGVHSACNTAWYIIKEMLQKEGLQYRIPNRMVYDNLSSLAIVSSEAAVLSFYQHCVASERRYGMITVFIEYNDNTSRIMPAAEGVVDAVLSFSLDITTGKVEVEAEKLNGLEFSTHAGKKEYSSPRI